MRKLILLIISIFFLLPGLKAQDVALKTNTLYWLGTTPNLGIEFATSRKVTLELTGSYNPWTFSNERKTRFWFAQPAARYWFCEKFEGHFMGVHAHGGQFFAQFGGDIYDGWLVGGGLSYGYDWILSPHWNIEAEIGLGYAHLKYKQSPEGPCLKCRGHRSKNYAGPTKAAVSFIYIF